MNSKKIISILLLCYSSLFSQITVDFTPFDAGNLNGWNLINGSQTNKWSVAGNESYYNSFSRISAYISYDNGTTYGYLNNSASVVHMYKDILVNTISHDLALTFNLKCFGEEATDYFTVYHVPTTITPQAGVEIDPKYKLGMEMYDGKGYWRGIKIGIYEEDVKENYMRIVFTWKNDNNGIGSLPAAIDNIRISELNMTFGNWVPKASRPAAYYGGTFSTGFSIFNAGGDITGGGVGSAQLSEYNILSNTWNYFPVLPKAIRLNELINFGDKIISIGGFNNGTTEPTDEVYEFSRSDFSWSQGLNFEAKVFYHRLGVHERKTLYSFGGSDETNTLLNKVYYREIGSNDWNEATPMPGDGRADGGCAILDKRIVYIGGFTNSFDFPVQVDSVFVGIIDPVNPANITWERRSNFPGGPRARLRAFEWGTNKVIVVGGTTGQGFDPIFSDVWAYDIETDQWTQLTDFPTAICAYFGGSERIAQNVWAAIITGGVKTGPVLSDMTHALFDTLETVSSVETFEDVLPEKFILAQNYPNPFNPSTTIQFSIPERSFVKLEVFNTLGEKVSTLVSEELKAGNYKYEWNAESVEVGLSSGIYFYKFSANEFTKTNKMILLK